MIKTQSQPKAYSLRLGRLTLLAVLLLAFFLRTYQLDSQSLRGDEAATVLYSAMPVTELWELSRVTDPHPPLYYLMLHPWQWLIGEEAWVMRYAGVIASTLAVAGLYRLTQLTLRNSNIGLLAAALLALSPLQIWLAQDVRSYPFFTLLGLLSSWALWVALKEPKLQERASPPKEGKRDFLSRRGQGRTAPPQSPPQGGKKSSLSLWERGGVRATPWLLYIFLTVACFYIHYYTVFLIAFQGLFVLLNFRKFWRQKWVWLTSQIIIVGLMIPGLGLAYNFVGQAAGGIEKVAAIDILRRTSAALLTGFTIEHTWGLWLSLLLVPIWITGLVVLLRRDFTTGSFWTLFFAVPVGGVIALSIDRPFFKERFLVQAQPAFDVLLAVGIITLARVKTTAVMKRPATYVPRLTAAAILAVLLYANNLALSNYFTNVAYAKAPPWHLYHDYVAQKSEPGDVMLTNFPEAAISYYSPKGLPFYVVPVERDRSVDFRLEETRKIANAYERIWFLPLLKQGFDEQGEVLNWLDRHADRVDQIFFPVYHLNLYLGPSTIDAMLIEQPAAFSHNIALRGYQILDKRGKSRLIPPNETEEAYLLRLEPEDEFTLSLYWTATEPIAEPYTVFTHLIAADGFNRTSRDNQPVWGTYPTTAWSPGEKITDKYTLTIPPGAPPGDHRLRIGWYHSDTSERVFVLDDQNQPAGDHLILNAIIRVE